MYVRETIDFEHRTDLQTDNLEILCIEVKPKFSKSFLVLAWYRPPKYEHETLNTLETLLKTIENENKEIILIGDINCNDLNTDYKNKVIDHLRSVYRQFQMKQLIKFPTRSTLTSQTLIDHFASNKPGYIIDPGVFTTGFSGHDLIHGVRKVSSRINREPKITKSRQLKNYDPAKFRKELQQVDWESIIELNDVNAMSLEWEKEFIRVLDKHAPIRQRKVRNSYAPYIDKELKHKMFMRDFYKKRFSKTKNTDDWKFYQDFRNTANVEKCKKKKVFYSHKLDKSKNDIKNTWKLLNMAIGTKSKTTKINSLTINGKILKDPKEIADKLINQNFCTTARRVQEETSAGDDDIPSFDSYLTKVSKIQRSFKFKRITSEDIVDAIAKLKNSWSENIPTRFFKDSSKYIAPSLAVLFNKSVTEGIFPDNKNSKNKCNL